MTAHVDIIIVNWNAGHLLRDCLISIVDIKRDGLVLDRVVIVDNASSDGSLENLGDLVLPLTVIANSENVGFAKACNQGATDSKADYLLFLNPDVRLFTTSLTKPVQFMERSNNGRIGICGIQLVDEQGQIKRACSHFPTPGSFLSKMLGLYRLFPRFFPSPFMTEWDHADSRQVDQVMGAFFMVKQCLFEELEGFDECFFVYFEEVDFSYRSYLAGWHSYFLANTRAYHKGGGTSELVKAERLFYYLRSRIQYGYKHFGWATATGLALGTLFLEPIARLALGAIRGSKPEMLEASNGCAKLWKAFILDYSDLSLKKKKI
jgi:N-acetylglucosaminyl-diphospho-decaprenol L-rhamnosyltransferase